MAKVTTRQIATGTFSIEVDPLELLPRWVWSWVVRKRENFTCQRCGRSEAQDGIRTDAHHLDEDKTNNRTYNGECVCKPCHARDHHTGKRHSPETIIRMRSSQNSGGQEKRLATLQKNKAHG